jgi:hypothetical protein
MPVPPRGLFSLLTGFTVALLIIAPSGFGPATVRDSTAIPAVVATVVPAAAIERPDAVITGSIAPAVQANLAAYVPVKVTMSPMPLALPEPHAGSDAFQQALALVETDPAAAFALAAKLDLSAEKRTIEWAADLLRRRQGALSPRWLELYAAEAPAFADADVFRTRLEQAHPGRRGWRDIIKRWAARLPTRSMRRSPSPLPMSPTGRSQRVRRIARQIWTARVSSTRRSRGQVLERLGALLTGRPLGSRRAPDDARPRHRRPSACSPT